jgi:hypothetical protein
MPTYRRKTSARGRSRTQRVAMMPNSVASRGIHWTTAHHSFKGPVLLINKKFAEGTTTLSATTFYNGARSPGANVPNDWSESRTGTYMFQGNLLPTFDDPLDASLPATNGPLFRVFLPNGFFTQTNAITPVNTTYWGGSAARKTLANTMAGFADDRYQRYIGTTIWARVLGAYGQSTTELLSAAANSKPAPQALARIKGVETFIAQNSSGNDSLTLFLPYVDFHNPKPWDSQWCGYGIFDLADLCRFHVWSSEFYNWFQEVSGSAKMLGGRMPYGKEFAPIPALNNTDEFVPYCLKFRWRFKFWHASQHSLYQNPRILNMFKKVAVRVLVLEYITPKKKSARETDLGVLGRPADPTDPGVSTTIIDAVDPINPSELKLRFETVDGFKTKGIEHGLQYTNIDLKSRINRRRYKVHMDRTIYMTLDELYKHTGGFTSRQLKFTHVFSRRSPFRFRSGASTEMIHSGEVAAEYGLMDNESINDRPHLYKGLLNHRIFPYVIPRFPVSSSAMVDMMMCRVTDSALTTLTAPEARQEVYRNIVDDGTTTTTNTIANTYNPNYEGGGVANQATCNLVSVSKNTYLRQSTGVTPHPYRAAIPQQDPYGSINPGKQVIATVNNHMTWGTQQTAASTSSGYMLGLMQGFQLSVEDSINLGVTTNIHPRKARLT